MITEVRSGTHHRRAEVRWRQQPVRQLLVYMELLLRDLLNKEKSELIKAEVLRQSKDPYHVGARVLVDDDGVLYSSLITSRRGTLLNTYVNVVSGDQSEVSRCRPLQTGHIVFTSSYE